MLTKLLEKIRNRDKPGERDDTDLVPVAAATLLLEVAWADHDIADDEVVVIRKALVEHFALDDATATEVIEESRQQHDKSVGLHRFTRAINDAWDETERFDLVVRLWELALSDQVLDRFEEHTIRKIAELLYISHSRFIEAKQIARTLLR